MLASSFTDPVLGVDVHFEMVPTPAPVPTPIPNPFTGVVFDPVGLAAGLVIGAAVSAVLGAPITGPVLYWTAFPATNTGTEAKHVPGHIIIPPGTAWAPFPKTPKPVIHPGETPEPALPVKPEDDAVCIFGSKTVTVMGSNAVRLGDIALSCSEPVRLPSSVVLAVPKGAPILIGGPPSLDILSALLASLRTRFISDSLHAAVSRLRPSRFRNFLHRAVCFLTGHPVDVASGRVLSDFVDLQLPGPLPLTVERIYSSAFSSRDSIVGHGWSLSLDQAIWAERGQVVLRAEDGREIVFDTFDLPGHRITPGQSVRHPIDRLTLHCEKHGTWRVVDAHGITRHFAPVAGGRRNEARLLATVSRCGFHRHRYEYDAAGRLAQVTDACGRELELRYDPRGRLRELWVPADGGGKRRHRAFGYEGGNLVEVVDSASARWRFEYVGHLLVRETDRAGLSFYFQYDGLGEDASCTRTWGDGGIYDHVITYDKPGRKTAVTDSRGFTTMYAMNLVGLVVEITGPTGSATQYSYDEQTFARTKVVDALGRETRYRYDERGNVVEVVMPDGAATAFRRHPTFGTVEAATDPNGGQWQWWYDRHGRMTAFRSPNGETTRHEYDGALPVAQTFGERRLRVQLDPRGRTRDLVTPRGAHVRIEYDALGRPARWTSNGAVLMQRWYDTEGRLIASRSADGETLRFEHDAEGNLLRAAGPALDTRFEYAGYHQVVRRIDAHGTVTFVADTEDNVIAIENELGERYGVDLDERGLVVSEHSFDGRHTAIERDACGRISRVRSETGTLSYEYDPRGRVSSIESDDGAFVRYVFGADGLLREAANEHGTVVLERDLVGNITTERLELADGSSTAITSQYVGSRRTLVHTTEGLRVATGYDRDGRANAVSATLDATSWNVEYETDPGGELVRAVLPGELVWSRRIGEHARVANEQVSRKGVELVERTYVWGSRNVLSEIHRRGEAPRTFEYDARGVPVTETHGDERIERPRDRAGRPFTSRAGNDREYAPGGYPTRAGRRRYTWEGGRLTAWEAEDGTTELEYDGLGRLTTVRRPDGTEVALTHDALGRRLGKTVTRAGTVTTTRWVWDGDLLCHEIRDAGTSAWVHRPGTFAPAAALRPDGAYSIVTDAVGSPTEVADEHGSVVWRGQMRLDDRMWTPPGNPAEFDQPFRWPGQYEDSETGLYANGFRYFDPHLGLYTQDDPLGLAGSLYLLGYVPNPLVLIDPLGLGTCGPDVEGDVLVDNSFLVRAMEGHPDALAILRRHNAFIAQTQLNEFFNVTRAAQRRAREQFLRRHGIETLDPFDAAQHLADNRHVYDALNGACESADAQMVAIARGADLHVVTHDGRLFRTLNDTFGNQNQGWGSRMTLITE